MQNLNKIDQVVPEIQSLNYHYLGCLRPKTLRKLEILVQFENLITDQ